MTDTPRPYALLIDDELLLNGVVRMLRQTRLPVLTASTAEEAGALQSIHEVGVIACEPHDARLAAFLIETRERHPSRAHAFHVPGALTHAAHQASHF